MEWTVLFFTIVLSVVAIGTTRWYGREAGKRLEETKTILSRMDKEVLKEMKGILKEMKGTLEEIRRGVHHLVKKSGKHNKSKQERK